MSDIIWRTVRGGWLELTWWGLISLRRRRVCVCSCRRLLSTTGSGRRRCVRILRLGWTGVIGLRRRQDVHGRVSTRCRGLLIRHILRRRSIMVRQSRGVLGPIIGVRIFHGGVGVGGNIISAMSCRSWRRRRHGDGFRVRSERGRLGGCGRRLVCLVCVSRRRLDLWWLSAILGGQLRGVRPRVVVAHGRVSIGLPLRIHVLCFAMLQSSSGHQLRGGWQEPR